MANKVNKEVKTAIAEAKRFLKRAEEFKARMEDEKQYTIFASKEGGALKRASLDLTRALAEMRKHPLNN